VGRDTRESGEQIERDLAVGATAGGATVVSAGVIPTPAVAHLTRSQGFAAGLVISASHNPFDDNGIKVFSGGGEKFTEGARSRGRSDHGRRLVAGAGRRRARRAAHRRKPACTSPTRGGPSMGGSRTMPGEWRSTAPTAPRTRRRRTCCGGLGFELTAIGCEPDGRNINLECGSTHPERLARWSSNAAAPLGAAFDGDGDRVILVDAAGRIVDGDAVMLLCARQMQAAGRLRGNAVVATVMSNMGLEIALRDLGIALVRCPVGDKYVMEELLRDNLSLGGEQSGHVIFPDFLYTGDGIVTALSVLRVMAETGRSLADLAGDLKTFPQVLLNLRVRERRDWMTIPAAHRSSPTSRRSSRAGPPAGAILGHGAAAARHDRRGAPGRD